MVIEKPDYYDLFVCIADKCPDTCCAGWEVDLDEDTWEYYQQIPGSLGKKLRSCMREDGQWRYIALNKKGRCPFLQDDGLCEIILQIGEESLSVTCSEHPRYFVDACSWELQDLSLGCPEAARLFFAEDQTTYLRQEDPTQELEESPEDCPGALEEVLSERNRMLELFGNRGLTLKEQEAAAGIPVPSDAELADILCRMDPLNADWKERIERLCGMLKKEDRKPADLSGFSWEFSRLACYLIFRYWTDAYFERREEISFLPERRLLGCSLALLGAMCEDRIEEKGNMDRKDLEDIAHLFSRQVEFDDTCIALLKGEKK